jgi:UTP--glucose-1-phosphate uridylyltransferase
MTTVRTAVFPVAGLGTRFLPATKAVPKELLPIVDRPLIQFAVDEAREVGIENFIFVTRHRTTAIKDHFDPNIELETALAKRDDKDMLAAIRDLRPASSHFSYVPQKEPLGLGHAVWCARHLVDDEPFAVLLPDDFLRPLGDALRSMMEVYERSGSNVVLVQEVPPTETDRYGIITPQGPSSEDLVVAAIEEKPASGTAKSNLAIVGRYILDAEIMSDLSNTPRGVGSEIQLTDALVRSLSRKELRAVALTGDRFDCGTSAGFIHATLAVALEREDIGADVRETMKELL